MKNSQVSVVIPTYNYVGFVLDAVESVLAQTYRPLEIIVVDDGSTDDTRARLVPYLDRIQYVYQPNQGLSAARNTGIRAARGELIGFLDADDLWHPRKLEIQIQFIEKHPQISLLATDNVTDIRGGWPELGNAAGLRPRPLALEELVVRGRFGPSGVLVRKECFQAIGLFDTELRSAEDRDMWVRVASRFPVAKLPLPLWCYRLHGGNMSNHACRMEENEVKVLRKAFTQIKSLRRRFFLSRKAFSYASYSAAYMYESAGMYLRALARILRSFLLWPFPYRRGEVRMALARPKMLLMILLRLFRIVPRSLKRRALPPSARRTASAPITAPPVAT